MTTLKKVLSYIPSPLEGVKWAGKAVGGAAQGTAHAAGQVANLVLGSFAAAGIDVVYGAVTLFDDVTGTSKAAQLAFVLKKVLHKEMMGQLEQEFGPNLDESHSVWLRDYLDNTLAPVISNFISDISIDRLLKAFTNSIRHHGPLASDAHIQAVANELGAVYADYLDRQPPGLKEDVKAAHETKRIVHIIINTFVQAMKSEPTLKAKFKVFTDKGKLAAIIQKALKQTQLVQNDKLSSQRVTTFLHYAMPQAKGLLAGATVALSPTSSDATSSLLNLAFSLGALKANRPGLATCVRETSSGLIDFVRKIDSYGLCRAIEFSIRSFGEERSRSFLVEVATLIGLNIQDADLDRLFNGSRLSQEGAALFQSIENQTTNRPLLEQVPYALSSLFGAMGYIKTQDVETTADIINQSIHRVGSSVLIDVVAQKLLPNIAQMEVVKHDKLGAKTRLPTSLVNQVKSVSTNLVSAEEGIKESLNQLLPWLMFSALCKAIGHSDIASKENYLKHIAPNLDVTRSIKIQVYQIAKIIKTRLLPLHHADSAGAKLKLLGASVTLSSTDLFINIMLNQIKRSLTFASYQLSQTAVLDRCMSTLEQTLEHLKADVLALEERGLEKGSDEWNTEVATIINERKQALFNMIIEETNHQIMNLPRTKFHTFVAVIQDKSLSFKRKVQLASMALIELIFSPFITLFLRLATLYTDTITMENHPIYHILSTVFELLDIEDNNNLLSNIVEETNTQLEVQADKLLIDKKGPDTVWPDNPQLDQFLLDFTGSVVDKASQLEGSISLPKIFANFMHHGRDIAKTSREAILDSMKPDDIRGYMFSGLKAFVPKSSSDKPKTSYEEHIDALQDRIVGVTGSVLQTQTRQSPYSHGSALSQLREFVTSETPVLSSEMTALAVKLAHSGKDKAIQTLAMKKIHLKAVYFLQEIERSMEHLTDDGSAEMAELKQIVANWHQQLEKLSTTFDQWRRAKDDIQQLSHFVLFGAQTQQIIDATKNARILELLDTMRDKDDDIFASWSRHHSMMQSITPVVESIVPGLAKKYIMSLSRMASLLSATPPATPA